MKKFSQGLFLLTSVLLSTVSMGGSVQSCAYKREMLPVRSYPLDFSCRSKTAFSAKNETGVSLCIARVMKHSSQISWPTPAAVETAKAMLADNVNTSSQPAAMNLQKQQIVVSCQLGHAASAKAAQGLLRASAQSSERCLRDDIVV